MKKVIIGFFSCAALLFAAYLGYGFVSASTASNFQADCNYEGTLKYKGINVGKVLCQLEEHGTDMTAKIFVASGAEKADGTVYLQKADNNVWQLASIPGAKLVDNNDGTYTASYQDISVKIHKR